MLPLAGTLTTAQWWESAATMILHLRRRSRSSSLEEWSRRCNPSPQAFLNRHHIIPFLHGNSDRHPNLTVPTPHPSLLPSRPSAAHGPSGYMFQQFSTSQQTTQCLGLTTYSAVTTRHGVDFPKQHGPGAGSASFWRSGWRGYYHQCSIMTGRQQSLL